MPLFILAAGLFATSSAAASTISEPASGLAVEEIASVRFDWRWDDGQYRSQVIFTQTADPNDPVWVGGDKPGKWRTQSVYDSNITIDFATFGGGLPAGRYYWRLCSYTIDGEDDKCYLEGEIRELTLTDVNECRDRRDNDGDNYRDLDDPGCSGDANGANEAASVPACRDKIDNDGDALRDEFDDGCGRDPNRTTEQPLCGDGIDDDRDGKVDVADPGCRGDAKRMSEVDPTPQRARFSLFAVERNRRCAIDLEVEVLPDIAPKRLFPFSKVQITVRGVGGRATGYRKTRRLPLGLAAGYGFTRLKPGVYLVSGRYLGDPWRLRSRTISRRVTLARSCR